MKKIKLLLDLIKKCEDVNDIKPIMLITKADLYMKNIDDISSCGYMMYENKDIDEKLKFISKELEVDQKSFFQFIGKNKLDKVPDWQMYSALLPIEQARKNSVRRYNQIKNSK